MNILKEVMQSAPEMKVIVNGDDALSAYLAQESGNPYVTYGISEQVVDDKDSMFWVLLFGSSFEEYFFLLQ